MPVQPVGSDSGDHPAGRTSDRAAAPRPRPRVFSNLNLNGEAPPRVHPKVGEWGPHGVPTTAAKKRMRIWVSIAFLLAVAALVGLGYYFYRMLQGG